MTSQLIISNAQGIAIASDSAVTLGGGRRTLDTAEKLFPLPQPHRIAVLHSGIVTLHGLPYSLLLNEWSSSLGDLPLPTVEDYRSAFLTWLGNNLQWLSEDRIVREWGEHLSRRFDIIRSGILERVEEDRLGAGPEQAALDEAKAWATGLPTFAAFENVDDEWLATANSALAERVDKSFEYWFDDIPRSAEIDAQIKAYAAEFPRRRVTSDFTATLAFAGYGKIQLLPSTAICDITGALAGRLLYQLRDVHTSVSDHDPIFSIQPLGQTSAIFLFLQGVESRMIEIASSAASRHLADLQRQLEPHLSNRPGTEIAVKDIFEALEDDLSEVIEDQVWRDSEERFVSPLRYAISGLPPATLADVARSLVELQALRQTTTAEQSTVGGPIDVAIISRAGGFEWVRHKSLA